MAGRIGYYGGIIRDGLVLHLDAAKKDSYPGSGTTWNDISGNNYTGTLTNNPSFNKNEKGSISFDGVDDYVTNIGTASTFSFIQNTGIFTIDSWVRPNLLGTAMYFIGNNDGTTTRRGFYIGKLANDNGWITITYGTAGQTTLNFQQNGFYTDTNWVNVVISANGTNAVAYKNGVQFGTSSTMTTFSTGDSYRSLGIGRINNSPTLNNWVGDISNTRIYNRYLTPDEIIRNYNSTKGRYGL